METIRLVWQLLAAVCVCNAAYISDDKSSIEFPHQMDDVGLEKGLPSIKVSEKQPFPLNNLNNCNENDEKGPLDSLLGGLLSSLLSVLSRFHNFDATKGGRGYEENCREYNQINSDKQISGNESVNDLNREDEGNNNSNDQTTDSDGSLIDADVDILNRDGEGIDADVDVLNRVVEENNFNDQTTESDGPLVDVNALSKCHEENNSNDQYIDRKKSSVDRDVELSRNDDGNNSHEQTTESGGTLVDADVDVLNGEEPLLSDTVGGLLKRSVSNAEDFTNLKNIDCTNEDMQGESDINEGNNIEDNNFPENEKHHYHSDEQRRIPPLNRFDEISNQRLKRSDRNEGHLAQEIPTETSNNNVKNNEVESSQLPKKAKSHQNKINEVNIPSKKTDPNERSDTGFATQHDLGRGESPTNILETQTRVLPFMFKYQIFPEFHINQRMPFDWNIQYGNLRFFEPQGNAFSQRVLPFKRFLPLSFFAYNQYPQMVQLPQSVASSNLYGAYAQSDMIPIDRYGCAGEGIAGGSEVIGSETSQTGSETSGSETTIDSSETSQTGSETSGSETTIDSSETSQTGSETSGSETTIDSSETSQTGSETSGSETTIDSSETSVETSETSDSSETSV